ncbi:uncharacterized protein LOC101861701, partial [Aplysia californica]|uniref:Uncharacterized protein LOC101861701 n=1 Tax=Aplysia californica TaxID=6500 RepID=A0ABM0K9D8_APLCA
MKMKPGVAWWLLVYLVAAYGVVAPVLSTSEEKGFKPDPRDPYLIHDYTDHYCNRPCEENAAPKICRYNFLIEHYITMSPACHKCSTDHRDCFLPQCVPGDGRKRGILTVNRMLPGPSIS